MADAPLCDCHGLPKSWNPDPRYRAGGFWFCRISKNEWARRKYAESAEVRLDRQLRNMTRVRISY